MILALILALFQFPTPVWVEKPVPHWSCPAGYMPLPEDSDSPVCEKYTPHASLPGAPSSDFKSTQAINWKWQRTIGANGKLRIDFPPNAANLPSCRWEREMELPIKILEHDKKHMLIHGPRGQELNLHCGGLWPR